MSENEESGAESFYSGALARIPHFMIALAVALSAAAWLRFGWRIALGFACGCAIAYLNFYWLERVVSAGIDLIEFSMDAADAGPKSPVFSARPVPTMVRMVSLASARRRRWWPESAIQRLPEAS